MSEDYYDVVWVREGKLFLVWSLAGGRTLDRLLGANERAKLEALDARQQAERTKLLRNFVANPAFAGVA